MLVKETIAKLIQKNQEVKTFIEEANSTGNPDAAIAAYANFLEQSNYNSSLSLSFTYVLQLGNDPVLIEQYELNDIEKLYDSIIEVNSEWVDAYVDAANFADAVMNNKQKAKDLVVNGIAQLEAQLKELKELSRSLEAEE